MKRYLFTAGAAALVAVLSVAPPSEAQNRWSAFAATDAWGSDANWDTGFFPDPNFDDLAIVGSTTLGAALTADVVVNGTFDSPAVQIADGADTSASLTIGSGSSLTVVDGADFEIGLNGGLGVLNVQGALSVGRSLSTPTSGAFQSTLSLSGSAAVSADYAFLDRQLRIAGPNVSFTTTGNDTNDNSLILGGGGVHTWEFDASGPSQLSVNGNLDLGGTLKIETPGYTPAVGSSWVLADSVTVDANDATPSGFGFVDTSGVPNLLPGTQFSVRSGDAGSIGVLTKLEVIQTPVLTVNRQTGVASLRNYSPDAATIDFDSYVIRSTNGSLAPAGWNSLESQSVGSGAWYEANPNANGLSELNVSDTLSLATNQSVDLGTVYAPPAPTQFGEENEDLFFQYGTTDGDVATGQIVYEGMPNNTLVLNIDPTTGAAQLLNPSGFTVGVDAYAITSDSGALSTTGWSSLDDQNSQGGDWYEANIDDTRLVEVLIDGSLEMTANQAAVVDIGSPWLTSGQQDLVFQFALEGENAFRTGKVVYGDLVSAVALPGDYNGDNVVNAADYTVWRDANGTATTLPNDPTPGSVGAGDYTVWASNYGATLVTSATAVPEPTGGLLALGMTTAAVLRRRQSGR